mmetsp:Transcript_36658/g.86215  ORF Transcript_36658/g.86215 Transcript_36658/m.86215 type:complete len:252 (+) Transcript_36658:536-1291(+)
MGACAQVRWRDTMLCPTHGQSAQACSSLAGFMASQQWEKTSTSLAGPPTRNTKSSTSSGMTQQRTYGRCGLNSQWGLTQVRPLLASACMSSSGASMSCGTTLRPTPMRPWSLYRCQSGLGSRRPASATASSWSGARRGGAGAAPPSASTPRPTEARAAGRRYPRCLARAGAARPPAASSNRTARAVRRDRKLRPRRQMPHPRECESFVCLRQKAASAADGQRQSGVTEGSECGEARMPAGRRRRRVEDAGS